MKAVSMKFYGVELIVIAEALAAAKAHLESISGTKAGRVSLIAYDQIAERLLADVAAELGVKVSA